MRNTHIHALIILGPLGIPVVVQSYFPQYINYSIAVAFIPIVIMLGALPIHAYINAPKSPHLKMLMSEYPKGTVLEEEMLIDPSTNAVGRFPALPMGVGHWCTTCKKWWKKNELENNQCPLDHVAVRRTEKPVYLCNRWWWPYLVKAKYGGIEVPKMEGKFELHGFLLPWPWNSFFNFGPRKNVYVLEELVDHPSSDIFVSVVSPYPIDYSGIQIPIHLGIYATGKSFSTITQSWPKVVSEINRLLQKGLMQQVIEQHKNDIFPQKEIMELIAPKKAAVVSTVT